MGVRNGAGGTPVPRRDPAREARKAVRLMRVGVAVVMGAETETVTGTGTGAALLRMEGNADLDRGKKSRRF